MGHHTGANKNLERVPTEVSNESNIAEPWDGYEKYTLPPKKQGRFLRNLRHQVFSLYRRLFGIVLVVNMSIFVAILCQGGATAQRLGLIVTANISSSIFMRQDYVINAFFAIFCAVPLSWPLRIRTICARVYHIGGLHSGFAISGTSLLTVIITYCILVLLLGIVVSAIPVIRSKYHNRFEVTHRFLGWTATLLVWCQQILVISLTNDYKHEDQSLGHSLLHAAPFWLVLVMTISIMLPWLRLRKIPVRSVVLSSHAVRLYFDYATPVAGSFVRISDSPLTEWHSFATIAEPGKRGFSSKIQNPPSEIWVRGIPTTGFIHVAPLFRRVVLVATGSGIGPCMPCILEQRVPIRLLWTSPNVRETFGDELVDTVMENSPDAVIYDTRVHGRPDMVKLTYRLVQEFKAEAVCIISNQTLTQKVVYGLTSRGIPAFGAIWDS
ncbi:hypothetical protein EI94DRAFT_1722068 [Lactarius quietus]|nr:hypothetical protein EI94DRAFT_1722068 [Lactarius quietus]